MPDTVENKTIFQELCNQAQKAWFTLLGFLAFFAVVILSTSDADFLVNTRQTQIPLLSVSVPTERFFFLAPIVATVLYCYLHYFCIKLWQAAGKVAPDALRGCSNLIGDVPLFLRRDVTARGGGRGALVGASVSALLLWAAAPGLLLLALTRSRAASDSSWLPPETWPHLTRLLPSDVEGATVLGISVMAAMGTASLLGALALRWPVAGRPSIRAIAVSLALALPFLQLGEGRDAAAPGVRVARQNLAQVGADWPRAEEGRERFRGDWCGRVGLPPNVCAVTPVGDAEARRLDRARQAFCRADWRLRSPQACAKRFAERDAAFAADWKKQRRAELSRLAGVDLSGRDLAGAAAAGSVFTGARLERADLTGATLYGADFEGASLLEADLAGAEAYYAVFDRANLTDARMPLADFTSARFEGADLPRADLAGARLGFAMLADADLREADLSGADLGWARLDRADLTGAVLDGVILDGATLTGARLKQDQLGLAVGDADTLLPPGLAIADCWRTLPAAADRALSEMPAGPAREAAGRRFAAHLCPRGARPQLLPAAPRPEVEIDRAAIRATLAAAQAQESCQTQLGALRLALDAAPLPTAPSPTASSPAAPPPAGAPGQKPIDLSAGPGAP